jgi:hypothetical protein
MNEGCEVRFLGVVMSSYPGVEPPAAPDRALAMLARRPLSGTFAA